MLSTTHLKFGIPDIELARTAGGTVNPACFVGHVLVVLFCPTAAESEAAELDVYRKLAPHLGYFDAWLVTVSETDSGAGLAPTSAIADARDEDGSAWAAFREIAPAGSKLERTKGATYLFGRGGSLQRVWSGKGHASEVLDELARPSCETPQGAD